MNASISMNGTDDENILKVANRQTIQSQWRQRKRQDAAREYGRLEGPRVIVHAFGRGGQRAKMIVLACWMHEHLQWLKPGIPF